MPAPSTEDQCFCDANNLGVRGVSCGDCPRDYKQEPAPSTAGEPTHQGKNHEQQVRPEMDAVGGQESMEGAGDSGHIDRAGLVARILALLELDAAGSLVPHGVGGHARSLLTSAATLLQSAALPVGELTDEQIVEIGVECDAIPEDCWSEAQIEFARAILAAARPQPVRWEPVEEMQEQMDEMARIISTNAFYQEGHEHGLEWAAQCVEYNDPRTGDWMWDDRNDLANAIRKGPEMPPVAQPVLEPLTGERFDALVEDLSGWSRYVQEDTAHQSLEKHVLEVLGQYGITQGGKV